MGDPAQSNEVAVGMLVGMQSSEDWLGLRVHFFPEHIGFSAGLLECLFNTITFPRQVIQDIFFNDSVVRSNSLNTASHSEWRLDSPKEVYVPKWYIHKYVYDSVAQVHWWKRMVAIQALWTQSPWCPPVLLLVPVPHLSKCGHFITITTGFDTVFLTGVPSIIGFIQGYLISQKLRTYKLILRTG